MLQKMEHQKKHSSMSPGQLLKAYVCNFIYEHVLDSSLELEIPKKWEKYGDFILFDKKAFQNNIWDQQDESFWLGICNILKCNRLGIKSNIKNDNFRTPNVKIIVGHDPWIIHTDNSITYTWNVERNMFCAGNAPERHRIAQLNCQNEVIVDLFAGIGYFTLPFLVHAKAKFVHACEWNPVAIEALKKNLKLNKVEEKCIVYEGDNRLVCPKNVADRVNLGLIPSSEDSWKVACNALKPGGGILHLHGNVETKKSLIFCEDCKKYNECDSIIKSGILMNSRDNEIVINEAEIIWKHDQWVTWGIHVLHSLISILREINGRKIWCCSIDYVHFVKSYAPHVHHLVLDVTVKTINCDNIENKNF